MNEKDMTYVGTIPFTDGIYVGHTRNYFANRKRLHLSQCISTAKPTMDRMHAIVLKHGMHRLLLAPFADRRGGPEETTIFWRSVEDRGMTLLDSNLNTQGQSVRGMTKVNVVS